MPLKIIRNDIVKMHVDAIVNAANSALKMGGGVCGAIFTAAGADKLQAECDTIGKCSVGHAVITKGYNLPAKYIIHTVGPVWKGGTNDEAQLLSDCYRNSLMLALEKNLKSIAFPLIASGIFGYPKDEALSIATSTIGKFLLQHDMMVYLVVYDKKALLLSEKLFNSIEKYIDDHYIEEHNFNGRNRETESFAFYQVRDKIGDITECDAQPYPHETRNKAERSLKDVVAHLDESFSQMLLRLIAEKGFTDVETYKKANIDRKLFSKIRSDKNYNPSKITAISFAIALELSIDETKDLLAKAGYTLSHSNKFDIIIEYFIEAYNYNIFEINEALFTFDQSLLG